MKSKHFYILIALFAAMLLFSGCGEKTDNESETTTESTEETSKPSAKGGSTSETTVTTLTPLQTFEKITEITDMGKNKTTITKITKKSDRTEDKKTTETAKTTSDEPFPAKTLFIISSLEGHDWRQETEEESIPNEDENSTTVSTEPFGAFTIIEKRKY